MGVSVAILDDYQRVARALGPWDEVGDAAVVTAFDDHVADDDALVQRLTPFEVVVAMRERTPFRASGWSGCRTSGSSSPRAARTPRSTWTPRASWASW